MKITFIDNVTDERLETWDEPTCWLMPGDTMILGAGIYVEVTRRHIIGNDTALVFVSRYDDGDGEDEA
jgi:hypothetical protein